MFTAFGLTFPEQPTELELHLACFLHDPKPEVGGLGKAEHFWRICAILWGPKSAKSFVRHPWAEKMTVRACETNYLGISGAASSGKSDWGAVWGIVNWLAAPKDTLVLCTSTSLKESGKRIWGSIKAYHQAAGLEGVGKLVESLHAIRTNDGSGVFNDKEGIFCIAGEKKDEKDAIGKLIGAKNKRVIVIADELPELTHAILSACLSNLSMNPWFQMVALGNFKSEEDAFGVFIRPKKGYDSISVEDDEWETELGMCLHLDGTRSPNILAGQDIWPIYGSKQLAGHKKNLDPNSAEFWRMCRSFGTPIGLENVIYSEADFLNGKARDQECLWLKEPVRVASMDPSFTTGGDRCPMNLGSFGQCVDGVFRLKLDRIILLQDDVTNPAPRDYQIARKFRDKCLEHGVLPFHAALDTSGAGSVLWSILAEEWSKEVLMVNFSGSATEMYVRANDTNTGKAQFDRRVSELWWVGREFMKYGQIKGITSDLARELKARRYDTIKGAEGLKVQVETKKEMKKRLGFSPDLADSWCVLLDLCRQRLRFLAGGENTGQNSANIEWDKQVEIANDLYEHATYEDQGMELMVV